VCDGSGFVLLEI